MSKKIAIILFALLATFAGCTISEHVHFNEDFSGKVTYSFDLSMLKTFAESDTSDFGGDMEKSMEEAKAELLKYDGISDVKYSYDTSGIAKISYSFKDLDTYNKTMENEESFKKQSSSIPKKGFEAKGKKLVFSAPAMPKDSTYDQMGEMRDMFQYDFSISFDKEIKKIKVKKGKENDFEQSEDRKQLTSKGNIYEVFPDYETEIIISFKK